MDRHFFFDRAWLPGGWRSGVRATIRDGLFDAVTPDAVCEPGDERAALAVPGMPNLHSHAFQRAMAGLTERRGPAGTGDFWSWRELMYRFVAQLDADDIEAIAAYAYADMLEAGFTSVAEFHYLHRTPAGGLYSDPAELALRHLAAADTTGIGITLLPVFYESSDFGGAPPAPQQRRFVTDLDEFARIVEQAKACAGMTGLPTSSAAADDRGREMRATIGLDGVDRRVGIAPHSLRAVTPGGLHELLRLLPGEVIHTHAAEQLKEVSDSLAWSGQRPVEWLLAHAPVGPRWCIVHATHIDSSEIAGLARSGAIAGLCPVTEANLGDGLFPSVEYGQAGGRWGVGTDSNVSIDAAGELRQLEYSQRLHTKSRNVLGRAGSTGRSLFEAALAGGSQALGMKVGAIAPGHRADLLLLDESHPDLADRSGDVLLDTWIFSAGRRVIRTVIAGGETVVDGHRHRCRERIDSAYRRVATRLTM